MLQTKFLSAGSSTEEALVYVCELASSIFLEEDDYPGVDKIDIRCESAKDAEKLDELLWIFPEDVILPHNLTHKKEEKIYADN